jgi:hypothetical protein
MRSLRDTRALESNVEVARARDIVSSDAYIVAIAETYLRLTVRLTCAGETARVDDDGGSE